MLLGLRTIVCPAPDLDTAKIWFRGVVGEDPSFDQPFYVGFQVGGHELGLDPSASLADGPITYWGVADADAALEALLASGASARSTPVRDVGDGIRLASVRSPGGPLLGVIENPHAAGWRAGRGAAGRASAVSVTLSSPPPDRESIDEPDAEPGPSPDAAPHRP